MAVATLEIYNCCGTHLISPRIYCTDSELALSGCSQVGYTEDSLRIVYTFLCGSPDLLLGEMSLKSGSCDRTGGCGPTAPGFLVTEDAIKE